MTALVSELSMYSFHLLTDNNSDKISRLYLVPEYNVQAAGVWPRCHFLAVCDAYRHHFNTLFLKSDHDHYDF